MAESTPFLSARGLHKTYRKHAIEVQVLNGLDLEVQETEFLAVAGHSGSGKSTLLHLLGTLDQPDQGRIYLAGERIDNVPSDRRDALRNHTFGFIFQFYHLLPELTTLENVILPQMIGRSMFSWFGGRRGLKQQAVELLDRVGLAHRLHHKPRELSGGEMQRAAIARALINKPAVLFADEPTGNLDADKGMEIVRLLRDLNRQERLTIIMVTHNLEIVSATDRVVQLVKGRVKEGGEPAAATEALAVPSFTAGTSGL